MTNKTEQESAKKSSDNVIFTLDIGTRSIIGMTGIVEDGRLKVTAIEKEDHTKRAMIDGQIENIREVASLAASVKKRLEDKIGISLTKVCVAAAGRALKTEKATFELELKEDEKISEDAIRRLEAGAIEAAEQTFDKNNSSGAKRQFFLVGYSVMQYYLDNYPISSLTDHHGTKIKVDIIATFLPSEVVESLYTTMQNAGLEVASLTLEPIAAINAAIPDNLRLLNLALVDIGAGTSDIAVCRDGNVTGYTMATIAGDEITETLMKHYLVDFDTAEQIKFDSSKGQDIIFQDILGFDHTVTDSEVLSCINESSSDLCKEICERIMEVNGTAPSAVFLAGGGSQLSGLKDSITEYLHMDENRVAVAGNNFQINAFSDEYDLNNPEYTTPLGIAVSTGLNLINDSFHINLNGKQAKLFRSGTLSILDILMMNGYRYQDLFGHSGQNIIVTLNGKRIVSHGGHAVPAILRLNGTDAKVTDIVKAGDSIEFIPAQHGEDAYLIVSDLADMDKNLDITVNEEKVTMDTPLRTGDIIITKESGHPIEEEKPAVFTTSEKPESSFVSPEPVLKTYHFMLNERSLSLPEKEDGSLYYLMDMLEYSDLDFDNLSGAVVLEINGMPASFQQELKSGDVILIYEVPAEKKS